MLVAFSRAWCRGFSPSFVPYRNGQLLIKKKAIDNKSDFQLFENVAEISHPTTGCGCVTGCPFYIPPQGVAVLHVQAVHSTSHHRVWLCYRLSILHPTTGCGCVTCTGCPFYIPPQGVAVLQAIHSAVGKCRGDISSHHRVWLCCRLFILLWENVEEISHPTTGCGCVAGYSFCCGKM